MFASTPRSGLGRNLYAVKRFNSITNTSITQRGVASSISSRSFRSSTSTSSSTSSTPIHPFPGNSAPSISRISRHGHGLHRGAIVLTSLVQPIMANPSHRRNLSLWSSSSSQTRDPTADAASLGQAQSQSESESAASMALSPSTPGESGSIETDLSSSISNSSSTSTSTSTSNSFDSFQIPTPGSSTAEHVSDTLTSSTSETMSELASYGLGHASDSYFNIRYAEVALDWLVNTTGLPWWAVIASLTIAVRLMVAPVLIWSQGNAIRMNNIQPQMQAGMQDLQRAKAMGNQADMAEEAAKIRKLMKDNDVSVLRGFMVPVIQMPLFITFFFALRAIANAGLPSLKEGGFGWVTDLAAADPYYILPCVSAALTLGVIESGAETGGTQAAGPQQKMVKNVLRVLTVGVIPFIAYFPAAVFVFWSVNNGFSLLQLLALRTEWLKTKLKLPKKINHKPTAESSKGIMDQIRDLASANSSQPQTIMPTRRQVDSSREGAMRELLQDKSQPSELVKSSSTSSVQSSKKAANRSKKPIASSSSALERQIRENAKEEKRRRVEAARQRR